MPKKLRTKEPILSYSHLSLHRRSFKGVRTLTPDDLVRLLQLVGVAVPLRFRDARVQRLEFSGPGGFDIVVVVIRHQAGKEGGRDEAEWGRRGWMMLQLELELAGGRDGGEGDT